MTVQSLTSSRNHLSPTETECSTALFVKAQDGRSLAFTEYGSPKGFPLLYVHEAGSSRLEAAFFDSEARRKGFRLIALDRPGVGESDALAGFTRETCAEDLFALADGLHLARFGLLAAGSGTAIALLAAGRHPHRVAVVLGLSPQLPARDSGRGWVCRIARPVLGALLQWGIALRLLLRNASAERYVERLEHSLNYADRRLLDNPRIREHLIRVAVEAVRSGAGGVARDLALTFAPARLDISHLEMPVHLWQGSTESSGLQFTLDTFSDSLPDGCLHRLNNRGRFFYWRHTDEVFAAAQSALSVPLQRKVNVCHAGQNRKRGARNAAPHRLPLSNAALQ